MNIPLLAESVLASYNRMGDVAVVAICIIIFIILASSYVVRSQSFRIFASIIGLVFFAAIINIGAGSIIARPYLLQDNPYVIGLVYILRTFYHFLLFTVFFSFTLYATIVSDMPKKTARVIAIVATALFAVVIAIDIVFTFTGIGFNIDKSTGEIVSSSISSSLVFMVGYTAYMLFLAGLLFKIRKLIYKRVLWSFYTTMILAAVIRYGQMIIHESSLTTLTFLIPALPMLYIVHANPYDITTGTLSAHSMEDMISNLYAKKKPFIIMSLLLPDYDGEGKSLPDVVKAQTRRFTIEYFRDGTLFQVSNGQIIMIARKDKNPDYNEWMRTILKAFQKQYQIYKMPYKIVYGESYEHEIGQTNYLSLIENIHGQMLENEMHRIEEKDILRFKEDEYIAEQLEDIARRCDLNDQRVLVYCQPVFNLSTKRFDTAEALMRLDLVKTGIVSPLIFIPIAEKRGYIHALTKIILNKTCKIIRQLCDEDYDFKRISVNVSSIELRADGFCGDVNRILLDNGVPGDKIALELTESQSQEDFLIMKKKIEMLHEEGVKFYLDDFGTGYSNMERILELPFDIIKFDRSMVIASGENQRSERIIENLAKMFNDFDYRVLYEGIESDDDENRCVAMSAAYLQGFKFSRPIPIRELRGFFTKSSKQNIIN